VRGVRKSGFRTLKLLLFAVSIWAVLPAGARAEPNLLFGFTDNLPMALGSEATAPEQALGARGVALTLIWLPGKTALDTAEAKELALATAASTGMRVILSIRTIGADTPLTDAERDEFCTYARNAIASFPSINDVVVGNEPNSSFFWRPQYNLNGSSAAPGGYEALLAHCYDVLHDFRPGINIAAPATSPDGNDNPYAVSNISHSPANFILDMGAAYRASGRTRPIFDTIVHHPYPVSNDERPYLMHPGSHFLGEGDWNRLVATYQTAFAGTAQPVPGNCLPTLPCVPIWYLEIGVQTSIRPGDPSYYGLENVRTVPETSGGEAGSPSPPATTPVPDQGTQLAYSLRLAYCQPYVQAAFNFLVRDDPNLNGYQSGLFSAGWRQKGSYPLVQAQVADLAANRVSCAPPTAPADLTAHVAGSEVDLAWCGSSSSIGVSGYRVYRDGVPIGSTTDVSFADGAQAAGAGSVYAVRAYDAAGGVSNLSRTATATTQPSTLSCPAPLSPHALRVAAFSSHAAMSKRRAAARCIVPNVRGRSLRKARHRLVRARCRVGRVRHVRLNRMRRGVLSQSPRPGTHLRPGGRVNLTFARR
jgi:hypothetical protein